MTAAPSMHKSDQKAHMERANVAAVIRRLTNDFPEVTAEQVERTVRREHTAFDTATVRDFVPILVERAARTALRQQRHPRS